MTYVLRRERFGGILGDVHNYNVRALNHSAFCSIADHVRGLTRLSKANQEALAKRGFDLDSNDVRIVELPVTPDTTILSAPLVVWIEVTSACNLRCAQCFLDSAPSKSRISLLDAQRILLEHAEMGVLRVTLTGGEALLHPEIGQILALTNSKKLGLRVFSSGTLPQSKYAVLA